MDGILPLWKERGMTSHDCVFKLRKILHMKKIGHGGTLDPDVDGVLPICLGKGTKVIEYLQDSGKVYEGEITLGYSTTTEDASGETVARKDVTEPPTAEQIDQVMASFIGEIKQIPPMYSAVKVNGKRLYEYARANETVERPVRTAQITSFERMETPRYNAQEKTLSWRFRVVCGKGTYVRTLAVDTGEKLGYPAHMSDLTRTASGGFQKEQALTLAQVQQLMDIGQLTERLLPIEEAVAAFQQVAVTEELWPKIKNGAVVSWRLLGLEQPPAGLLALFYRGMLVSIYQSHPSKQELVKPSKVIRNE